MFLRVEVCLLHSLAVPSEMARQVEEGVESFWEVCLFYEVEEDFLVRVAPATAAGVDRSLLVHLTAAGLLTKSLGEVVQERLRQSVAVQGTRQKIVLEGFPLQE